LVTMDNLTNTGELRKRIEELQSGSGELPFNATMAATTDTEILTALLAAHPDLSLEEAAVEELPLVKGAFSLVFMDDNAIYAARDPQGIRPLVLGRLEAGWVVAVSRPLSTLSAHRWSVKLSLAN